jgi:hypothetical protein
MPDAVSSPAPRRAGAHRAQLIRSEPPCGIAWQALIAKVEETLPQHSGIAVDRGSPLWQSIDTFTPVRCASGSTIGWIAPAARHAYRRQPQSRPRELEEPLHHAVEPADLASR